MAVSIELSNSESIILIDDEDYDWLNQWTWYLGNQGYAQRNDYSGNKHVIIRIHNLILSAKDGYVADHQNRNKLDNRRDNLRYVTSLQSTGNTGLASHNTSGYKGVSYMKTRDNWRAYIKISRQQKFLGYFDNPEDAARAYNKAAIAHFGLEYAYLNNTGGI